MTTVLKGAPLWSLPRERAAGENVSWGTTGAPDRVWWDADSAARRNRLHCSSLSRSGLLERRPVRCLMFSYPPRAQGEQVTVSITLETLRQLAPCRETFYAAERRADGRLALRTEAACDVLRRYAAGTVPVRVLGLPFLVRDALAALREPLRMPEGSLVITAGGWKASDAAMSRSEFRRETSRMLCVPEDRIREGYGMTEHGVFYLECAAHRFHVPAHSRVFVRDPVSLAVAASGARGLLELVTPLNAAMPSLALLSLNLGRMAPDPCPCGLSAPAFSVEGRAGGVEARGCAARLEDWFDGG